MGRLDGRAERAVLLAAAKWRRNHLVVSQRSGGALRFEELLHATLNRRKGLRRAFTCW